MSLNRVAVMGRLTRDPELRSTQNGTAVTSFSIAVDRDFKGKDGEKEADFLDIVAWRSTAGFVSRYFTKGNMIAVDGRLQTRSYEDKDGNKRKAVEIVADSVYFGSNKRDDSGNAGEAYGGSTARHAKAPAVEFEEFEDNGDSNLAF